MAEETDHALIARVRSGDAGAYRQLLERHYGMIARVAYRFTGNQADAEDVTQNVCMGLSDKLHGWRGEGAFTTWLYRVVVHACRDSWRKEKSRQRLESAYKELEGALKAEASAAAREAARLYRLIAGMEELYRETALLILAEGLSHAQAGAVLACAENTVSWRMHEVKKRLKATMEKERP